MSKESREALTDQVEHLADEAEALKLIITVVPEAVLTARPLEGQSSIKEMYGRLVHADETEYLPLVESAFHGAAIEMADRKGDAGPEPGWDSMDITSLLNRLIEARRRLASALRACDEDVWLSGARLSGQTIDLYRLAVSICHRDVEILREVGDRLHSARLGVPRHTLQ